MLDSGNDRIRKQRATSTPIDLHTLNLPKSSLMCAPNVLFLCCNPVQETLVRLVCQMLERPCYLGLARALGFHSFNDGPMIVDLHHFTGTLIRMTT
jgi:hypothetical protein